MTRDGVVVVALPEGVSALTARLVLRHAYTGNMDYALTELTALPEEEAVREACSMLRLADMWDLPEQRQWAEWWLAGSRVFDIWNVCAVLTHAHACHAAQLTRLCAYQIGKLFSIVCKTAEWAALEPEIQKLATPRVVTRIVDKISPLHACVCVWCTAFDCFAVRIDHECSRKHRRRTMTLSRSTHYE